MSIACGRILIAEPFLADPNFSRSIVLLCEHGLEGSIGFVLNKPIKLTLGDLLPGPKTPRLTLYNGGPVQLDSLHMIHRVPSAIGGTPVAPGVFWGWSYESLHKVSKESNYQPTDIRLFVGYAGWSPGQLDREVEEGAWLVAPYNERLVFETDAAIAWKESVKSLGVDYAHFANLPIDPQMN